MVRETSVMKLSGIMRNLEVIYPDLKDKDFKAEYGRGDDFLLDEVTRKRYLGLRAKEIEKTTDAIVSFLEMGLINDPEGYPDGYLKKLIEYYLVLMDAVKQNLDFRTAYDDIFDSPTIGRFE